MAIYWSTWRLGIMKAVESFMPYGAFLVLAGGLVSTLAALMQLEISNTYEHLKFNVLFLINTIL